MKRLLAHASDAVAKRARLAAGGSSVQLAANGWTELGQAARVGYWPRLLASMSQRAMHSLLRDVAWQQRDVVLFGRRVAQPRLVAYMADADTPPYSYTGLVLQPAPWSELVLEIKAAVEALVPGGAAYNSCLLNQYRDGNDHVSWHADDEPIYGTRPLIASVSFGAPRAFVLRHNRQRTWKVSTCLHAGDVLLMAGATQQHWQHCIPKRKGVAQPRINLTFRRIV